MSLEPGCNAAATLGRSPGDHRGAPVRRSHYPNSRVGGSDQPPPSPTTPRALTVSQSALCCWGRFRSLVGLDYLGITNQLEMSHQYLNLDCLKGQSGYNDYYFLFQRSLKRDMFTAHDQEKPYTHFPSSKLCQSKLQLKFCKLYRYKQVTLADSAICIPTVAVRPQVLLLCTTTKKLSTAISRLNQIIKMSIMAGCVFSIQGGPG